MAFLLAACLQHGVHLHKLAPQYSGLICRRGTDFLPPHPPDDFRRRGILDFRLAVAPGARDFPHHLSPSPAGIRRLRSLGSLVKGLRAAPDFRYRRQKWGFFDKGFDGLDQHRLWDILRHQQVEPCLLGRELRPCRPKHPNGYCLLGWICRALRVH